MSTDPPRASRWTRRLLWLPAIAAVLLAAAWWGLPALLVSQLPPRLAQVLGRPVTLDGAAFVPWRLELTLTGLRIGAAADAGPTAPPLLQIERLRTDLSLASLRHRAPVIDALAIDGLRLNLARTAAGRYDIDDLVHRLAAPPADGAPPGEPARFALQNLALRDAQLRFDDRPVGRVHEVRALTLTLPFLSNLPADVAVHTAPRLAFTLDGTRFDSGAQALPFADTRSAALTLAFKDLNLAPWLPYLPDSLPLRLRQARLSSDLALRFTQPRQGSAAVSLQGTVALRDVALAEPSGAPLAGWQALTLDLRDVQPLARQVRLGTLRLDGATLQLARDAQGRLNLQRLFAPATAPAPVAAVAPAAAASAPHGAAPAAADAWRISLDALQLADARVRWTDDAVRPQAALQLDGLAVQARDLRWPSPAPLPVSLQGTLRAQRDGAPAAGTLQVEGQVNDQQATLKLQLAGLDLGSFAPYAAQALRPRLSGTLAADGELHWAAAPAALRLSLAQASLQDLQLRDAPAGRAPALATLKRLQLSGVDVDVAAQRATIARVQLQQPDLALARDAAGRLNVQQWAPAPATAARPVPARPVMARPAAAAAPWQVRLQDLALDGGRLRWTDALVTAAGEPNAPGGAPLRAELNGLRVRLQGLAWPAGAGARAPLPRLQLAARISRPAAPGTKPDTGEIDWNGRFGLAPLQAQGRLRLQRLPLHLFVPYAGDALPVALLHADAGFQGTLSARDSAAGWQVTTSGDLQVNELLVHTRPEAGAAADSGAELLSWQSLALQGLDLSLAAPARPRLVIREATLTDFYSRLVITEQGRFNLQDVAAQGPAAAASAPAGAASAPLVAAAAPAPATASAPATDTTAAVPDEGPIDLDLGATQLRNGRIDFTDRFIRPNYSARLTELNGQLGRLRSGTREMATISLRGRAAETALVDISGQINPTAHPLALDIRARATDLELAPLSPYAGKYAGYAIERGKLSMDVAYKIDPDGKLQASNQVILNQLTFGERIESPSATQLPVLLAVALLKDRHGVIDINLPISGSIDDPQFSVGGLIVKVIVNLLGKALTAPFALLSGGGGDDLSLVEFEPGTPRFTASGHQALAKVATALTDRPGLSMTVTGAADPVTERADLQRMALAERLQAEHRRVQLRSGGEPVLPTTAGTQGAPPLAPDERARLLKALYQQTALPNKPRNAIGLLRDLPPAEMEAMLLAAIPVNEDTARALALQRGLAVRDALIAAGLPGERLFIAAPKLRAAGEGEAAWTPRVQLSLSAR